MRWEAAGVLKLPNLFGHACDHIHGQVIVGAIVAACGARPFNVTCDYPVDGSRRQLAQPAEKLWVPKTRLDR